LVVLLGVLQEVRLVRSLVLLLVVLLVLLLPLSLLLLSLLLLGALAVLVLRGWLVVRV
jgi:hypothetical protein